MIHNVAVLADRHPCVALGNAGNHRSKAAQAIRQHIFAGIQFDAPEGNAVEHVISAAAFTRQDLGSPRTDIVL
ncbi:hypothetical protein D3C85_1780630 [compost metagenome]